MATLYSDQYADAYNDVPSHKLAKGDVNGPVRSMVMEYTLTSSVPAASDVIKMGKIPKGARLLEAVLKHPDVGGLGAIKIGWSASSDAVEAADDDGIMAAVDLDTAADVQNMSGNAASPAGLGKRFEAEVDVEITINDDWTATSGTLLLILYYTY